MRTRIRTEERGFTLVEVMVAALILVVGVLGTVALVDDANSTTQRSLGREAGTNLARELIENARLIPYPNVTSDRFVTDMQARPGLADASGASGWQIQRRNRTYTVTAAVCVLDDPKDGLGEHDSSFCPDSAAAGTADGNAKDYKRATFTLAWTQRGQQFQVRQATILAPRGTADLPKVTSLAMTSPLSASSTATPPPVITTNVASARFSVQTSTIPTGVSWLIDGGVKGLASGGGLDWYFDWPLTGKPDGTYQVGAQPFDASGASGAATEMTVKLNRFVPSAPSPVYAGFNVPPSSGGQRKVDVEWKPNSDKDVLGYRVYWQYASVTNVPTGTPTQVCPATGTNPDYSTSTTCTWTMPSPGGPDQVRLNVWVTAIDKNGSTDTLREGTSSTVIDAYPNDSPPNDPTNLSATRPGDGTVVLTWNPPATPDPDAGDKIIFYRIMRSTSGPVQTCASQTPLDRTPFETGTEVPPRRWVDASPPSGTTYYAVCAIDSHMRMSQPPAQVVVP